MINIVRGEKPASLERQEIRDYLDKLDIHNSLSAEERKKTPFPDAGNYRNSDLLAAFDRDFYSKCYLTEQKFANSWAMDVEHFKPKSQFPELKYEWSNLYPCSHDANLLKPKKEPIGGYLDPCNPVDDVEKEIVYTLGFGGESFFDPLDYSNIKAKNTAELLFKIHNGVDNNSKHKSAELRLLISKKAEKVKDLIMEWQYHPIGTSDKVRAERELKNILSRKSDFTMLLRSLSSVRKYIPKEFLD